jgi:hypothetical protein
MKKSFILYATLLCTTHYSFSSHVETVNFSGEDVTFIVKHPLFRLFGRQNGINPRIIRATTTFVNQNTLQTDAALSFEQDKEKNRVSLNINPETFAYIKQYLASLDLPGYDEEVALLMPHHISASIQEEKDVENKTISSHLQFSAKWVTSEELHDLSNFDKLFGTIKEVRLRLDTAKQEDQFARQTQFDK